MIKEAAVSTVNWLSLVSKAIAASSVVMGFLFSAGWLLFQERLEPITTIPERIANTEEVATQAVEIASEAVERIDEAQRRIAGVEREIGEIRGEDRIANYDPTRSFVNGPCIIGEWCEGQYVVSRTELGLPCLLPSAIPRIYNGRGLPHSDVETEVNVIRATLIPETVRFRFRVPEDALPGRGEFLFLLTYDCGGRRADEGSLPLQFVILESSDTSN